MTYDPGHHHRRSIRLKGYDYGLPGAYFVTMVAQDRARLFGRVANGEMALNATGRIVVDCWRAIPRHFPHVELDAFVIMPNHVHGIIVITGRGEALGDVAAGMSILATPNASPQRDPTDSSARPKGTKPGSLNAIVQNFKSVSTRRINKARGTPGTKVWQRDYFERVVRSADELIRIRRYITANPRKWHEDREYGASHDR